MNVNPYLIKIYFILIALFSVLIFSYFPSMVFAQNLGGVSVSPKRIVFDGRQRTADVTLINQGAQASTYRVFFGNMRMGEDGKYEKIKEPGPGDRFADRLIRYSPRQVVIPPGSSQTVRLMVRKPRDLDPGEYRSHLFFKSLPPSDAGASLEALDLKEGELSVNMIAAYSISIPILIRHGKLDATIIISDLAFEPQKTDEGKPHLSITLNRQGKRSVYGNLTVNFQSNSADSPVELGRMNGVAVFTPNAKRVLDVALYPPEGVNLNNGNLIVTFREDLKKGKGVFSETKLSIQ